MSDAHSRAVLGRPAGPAAQACSALSPQVRGGSPLHPSLGQPQGRFQCVRFARGRAERAVSRPAPTPAPVPAFPQASWSDLHRWFPCAAWEGPGAQAARQPGFWEPLPPPAHAHTCAHTSTLTHIHVHTWPQPGPPLALGADACVGAGFQKPGHWVRGCVASVAGGCRVSRPRPVRHLPLSANSTHF